MVWLQLHQMCIMPHKEFRCQVYILFKEESSRYSLFFNRYKPQFYFRITNIIGMITLKVGCEIVMRGNNINFIIE